MWFRRLIYAWLFPAAFLLPLWLLVGWGVFNAQGWAFLWVLFLAIPSVFIGQLAVTLLIRSRPSVRQSKAVSWGDALGIVIWNGLTISLGFYQESWWGIAFGLAVAAGVILVWYELRTLVTEARAGTVGFTSTQNQPNYPPAPVEIIELKQIREDPPSV